MIDVVNPLTFDIALSIDQQLLAAKYQNSILFAALVTLASEDKVQHYTSTYTQDN